MRAWDSYLIAEETKDTKEVSKVVMINSDDKILLLKRKENQKFPGRWDLPGGHLKEKESGEEGLLREVKEETNLNINEPSFLYRDGRHGFYKSYSWNGTLFADAELPEHVASQWFSLKEVAEMKNLSPRYLRAIKEAL